MHCTPPVVHKSGRPNQTHPTTSSPLSQACSEEDPRGRGRMPTPVPATVPMRTTSLRTCSKRCALFTCIITPGLTYSFTRTDPCLRLQLLRPEVERHAPWWAWLGALCGAGLGFIIANLPGLMAGAYAGNRLGAIRDAKGKSVAAVFTQLGGNQKAEVRTISIMLMLAQLIANDRRDLVTVLQILRHLAAKVLGAAANSM